MLLKFFLNSTHSIHSVFVSTVFAFSSFAFLRLFPALFLALVCLSPTTAIAGSGDASPCATLQESYFKLERSYYRSLTKLNNYQRSRARLFRNIENKIRDNERKIRLTDLKLEQMEQERAFKCSGNYGYSNNYYKSGSSSSFNNCEDKYDARIEREQSNLLRRQTNSERQILRLEYNIERQNIRIEQVEYEVAVLTPQLQLVAVVLNQCFSLYEGATTQPVF